MNTKSSISDGHRWPARTSPSRGLRIIVARSWWSCERWGTLKSAPRDLWVFGRRCGGIGRVSQCYGNLVHSSSNGRGRSANSIVSLPSGTLSSTSCSPLGLRKGATTLSLSFPLLSLFSRYYYSLSRTRSPSIFLSFSTPSLLRLHLKDVGPGLPSSKFVGEYPKVSKRRWRITRDTISITALLSLRTTECWRRFSGRRYRSYGTANRAALSQVGVAGSRLLWLTASLFSIVPVQVVNSLVSEAEELDS